MVLLGLQILSFQREIKYLFAYVGFSSFVSNKIYKRYFLCYYSQAEFVNPQNKIGLGFSSVTCVSQTKCAHS